jgi:hypothetical protein
MTVCVRLRGANRPCGVHTISGADATWVNYTLFLATKPARKVNQGPDAVKKQGAALCPEEVPVFTNIFHDSSSKDWRF